MSGRCYSEDCEGTSDVDEWGVCTYCGECTDCGEHPGFAGLGHDSSCDSAIWVVAWRDPKDGASMREIRAEVIERPWLFRFHPTLDQAFASLNTIRMSRERPKLLRMTRVVTTRRSFR